MSTKDKLAKPLAIAQANAISLPENGEAPAAAPKRPIPGGHGLINGPKTLKPVEKRVTIDPYIKDVLDFECKWFRVNQTSLEEPPVCPEHAFKQIKNEYENYDEYITTNIPYLYTELWADLFESYMKAKEKAIQAVRGEFVMSKYQLQGEFLVIDLVTTAAKHELSNYFMEGDVIVVCLSADDSQGSHFLTLGFVTSISMASISDYTNSADGLLMTIRKPNHDTQVIMNVRVKKRQIRLKLTETVMIQKLAYIKPFLRTIETLITVKRSILSESLIKPKIVTCRMVCPQNASQGTPEYNLSQYKAICGAYEAVNRPHTMPKIQLIQGPPGTGKTHTLVGIIKKIYMEWQDMSTLPKIMICAPSNGAVDEVAKRLLQQRDFMKKAPAKRRLRLVRVGQPGSIHPAVEKYSLDKLIEQNMSIPMLDSTADKVNALEEELMQLDMLMADYRCSGEQVKLKKCEMRLVVVQRELNRLKKQKDLNRQPVGEQGRRVTREEILRKADLILVTLNSCRQSSLEQVFNNPRNQTNFNCVIVDEASQCSEPELLMPLYYSSITKMILIGDPMQLPATVKSKRATNAGFGRSLFQRFFEAFGGYNENSPVLMLDEQYRMHEEICHFPSKQFYASRLKSHPSTVERGHNFPIQPYVVIDVQGTLQDTSNPTNVFNELEATFVISVCRTLATLLPKNTSVGIITPYQGQKKLIQDKLNRENFTNQLKLDVNTIDGFQGQERDVIVISAVRASPTSTSIGFLGSEQRMNVAVTRARRALIACCCPDTLKTSKLWSAFLDDATERGHLHQLPSTASQQQIKTLLVQPITLS